MPVMHSHVFFSCIHRIFINISNIKTTSKAPELKSNNVYELTTMKLNTINYFHFKGK